MLLNYKVKLLIALMVIFGLAFVCSSNKDTSEKKEETKKEETTKDETKDNTKTETTTSGNKLYFCEEYTNGKEVGVSDVFTIPSAGGYLTVMIKLDKPIGVGKVDLRISRKTGDTEKIIETIPFDVQPDWDYIHFDEVTFHESGMHKVTLLKPDGTPVASGEVEIRYR
jgi:hypothetical protein